MKKPSACQPATAAHRRGRRRTARSRPGTQADACARGERSAARAGTTAACGTASARRPPPAAGQTADVRPEGRRCAAPRRRTSPTNTHARDVVDARRRRGCRAARGTRCRSRGRVNSASSAADDEAARTGELELHLPAAARAAAGTTTHGPATGTHALQAAALVRRAPPAPTPTASAAASRATARAARASRDPPEPERRERAADEQQQRRRRRRTRLSSRASRCLCPSREPRLLVDLTQLALVGAVKNWPPRRRRDQLQRLRARAARGSCSVKPPGELVLDDAVLRAEHDRVDGDVQLPSPAARPPCGVVRPPSARRRR